MSGDVNGDKMPDYIIYLGDFYLKGKSGSPGAVIEYISDKGSYKRYPIEFWEEADNDGFFTFPFIKDLNNDGTGEVFIIDSSSAFKCPIIYTWEKGELIQLISGHELLQ